MHVTFFGKHVLVLSNKLWPDAALGGHSSMAEHMLWLIEAHPQGPQCMTACYLLLFLSCICKTQ